MEIILNKSNICEDFDEEWGWFVDTETLLTNQSVQADILQKIHKVNKLETITEEDEYNYNHDIEESKCSIINIIYLCKRIIVCISIYLLLIILY